MSKRTLFMAVIRIVDWIHIHFIRHFEEGIDTIELFFIVAIVFSRCRTLPGF